jgi:hypothetical protein
MTSKRPQLKSVKVYTTLMSKSTTCLDSLTTLCSPGRFPQWKFSWYRIEYHTAEDRVGPWLCHAFATWSGGGCKCSNHFSPER